MNGDAWLLFWHLKMILFSDKIDFLIYCNFIKKNCGWKIATKYLILPHFICKFWLEFFPILVVEIINFADNYGTSRDILLS
jgi:hypothetical protein